MEEMKSAMKPKRSARPDGRAFAPATPGGHGPPAPPGLPQTGAKREAHGPAAPPRAPQSPMAQLREELGLSREASDVDTIIEATEQLRRYRMAAK